MMKRLYSEDRHFSARLDALLASGEENRDAVSRTVADIIARVRDEGDAAVLHYAATLDRTRVAAVADLEVAKKAWQAAWNGLDETTRFALQTAHERIVAYAEHQKLASWSFREADGSLLGQRITALESVGIYVPGGKAAYPSSVLMNAVPAKVAGVARIVMVMPTPGGTPNSLALAAAHLCGVDEVWRIGGAHAIAALAYGTRTLAPVDKITGPGNAYVAEAKRSVFGQVGIDMIAGPSEVVVIADGKADPRWIAADLFAQAEHDEMAQSILLTDSREQGDAVLAAVAELLPGQPRRAVIAASLRNRGAVIRCADLDDCLRVANRIAPEHLELMVEHPEALIDKVRHAGAVFLAGHSSEVFGDYCAGPNHVLPTSRTARFSSPLGVYDFQKRTSVLGLSPAGARALSPLAELLAREEGLHAHALSARVRGGHE